MTKVLIIDDDKNLVHSVSIALEKSGFQVLTALDGTTGLKKTFDERPDLVLLDLMLPGMDGWDTCRRLREMSDVPIIMLTALATEDYVVRGLKGGADDYLAKPFGMSELIARIQNCLRHNLSATNDKPSLLVVRDLTIDFARHKVTTRGQNVRLSPTEFRLLTRLARSRGQVIPHRTLLLDVWGPEYVDQVDYLHLYISYLRRKIERDPAKPEIILTEWNIGYFMTD